MAIDERILAALKDTDALNRLQSVVRGMQAQGADRQASMALFEHARWQIRTEGRDQAEEIIW